MSHSRTSAQRHVLVRSVLLVALVALAFSPCRAQKAAPAQQLESPWTTDLEKFPQLPEAISHVMARLRQEVHFPNPRTESRLLPLLPQSSIAYAAIPNYGETASQSVKVFRQELQDSAVLRDWWARGRLAANGPKVLEAFEKFAQLHQFLGNELVLTASMRDKEPSFVLLAEVRKPGLKQFLQLAMQQLSDKTKPPLRILDPQELAAAKEKTQSEQLLILLRPDFAVAAADLASLRSFNAQLEAKTHDFVSTPFGQRVRKEYQDGVTVLAAADIHKILEKSSPAAKKRPVFQQSGFGDLQYLIWDHKNMAGKPITEMELSFSSPRRGVAAWLAKPSPLGSLDFVSPKALMALSLVLSDPAVIYDNAKELAALSNSNSLAAVPVMEQAMNLNLKDDLLRLLSGEVTFELDSVAPQKAAWRAAVAVKDADHVRQTLSAILTKTQMEVSQSEEGGVTCYSFRVPTQKEPTDIAYAFVDGYLILGSRRAAVVEAVQLHRSGTSLAKSTRFLGALPSGRSLNASALFYQDPVAMTALSLRSLGPEFGACLSKASGDTPPSVMSVYGEESAIRAISQSSGFDVAGALVVAAIAIPNLLRSRMAANEASAVGGVRTINVAEISYATMYPKRRFAPNLATLGPDPCGTGVQLTPNHAGVLDETLGNSSCVGDASCPKNGYNFRVTAACKLEVCSDYLVVATPVSPSTGTRSFCSTSDGVIRFKLGAPLTAQLTIAQCMAWPPLQ